ncbi:SURF1 family protein [Zooshikella marina]|uniref:SURF1 family protein n=1 Tax=Zooshikella ganghwensis TaxID=202772 RepID=UPI001BAF2849|nr:SURF1 family protein [Zooshikella ganghwensis]MBU2708253.1 SURF1 family protein [Zooshikella ganghwensis]
MKYFIRIALLSVVTIPLFTYLGFWQLGRAEEKQVILNSYNLLKNSEPVTIHSAEQITSLANYQPISLSGRFDNQRFFLLDNQVINGYAGYDIIMPFHLNNGDTVLINRGWVPQGISRTQLPKVDPIYTNVTLQGVLYQPSNHFTLKQDILTNKVWPQIIQRLNLAQLYSTLASPNVLNTVIVLSANSNYTFTYHLKPINMSPEKHTAYAVQWFALVCLMLVMLLVIGIHAYRNKYKPEFTSK